MGWLTATGDNLLDAQDNLQEALRLIKYKVASFDEESVVGKTAREGHLSAAVVKKDFIIQAAKLEKVRRISLTDQRKLHIGLAANKSHFNHRHFDPSVVAVAKHVEETLVSRGYEVSIFDFNNIARTFDDLRQSDVNLVFNLTEGINNNQLLKAQAAALLEALQIPYTGSSALRLGLCQDKISMKKLLAWHSIPTAKWDYVFTLDDKIDPALRYPLLVKPSNTDNSVGITNSSVVIDKRQLQKQVKRIITELRCPALIEEYIEGDEYEVSILGNRKTDLRVLPLTRSVFKKMPAGYWHIYTEAARRRLPPPYKKIILENPLRRVERKLEALITEIALDTYKILGCQDYGRVGVRVGRDGSPYVLELDPNPPLGEQTQLVKAAKITGMQYGDLLEEIIALAVKRYRHKKSILY